MPVDDGDVKAGTPGAPRRGRAGLGNTPGARGAEFGKMAGGVIVDRENGAQGRICTADKRFFSPLLYSLSYLGPGQPPRGAPGSGPSRRDGRL